jgi:hypothetical protein
MTGLLAKDLTLDDIVRYYLYGKNELPEDYEAQGWEAVDRV